MDTVGSWKAEVRSLVRRSRLDTADPDWERIFDASPGMRLAFGKRGGLSADGVAEILTEARIFGSGPVDAVRAVEIVEAAILMREAKVQRTRVSRKRVEAEVRKSRRNRWRGFECPACFQKARGTRNSVLLCGLCWEMNREAVTMVRIDRTPEEIETAAAAAEAEVAS